MQDAPKAVWSIPYVSVAFFASLKQNFIAYCSSSRPYWIFKTQQLWQSGFSRVYSNCCCSCSFEPEIIKIGQSSHKMYSNNILNFQESTTILNVCTKKSGDLLNAPHIYKTWTLPHHDLDRIWTWFPNLIFYATSTTLLTYQYIYIYIVFQKMLTLLWDYFYILISNSLNLLIILINTFLEPSTCGFYNINSAIFIKILLWKCWDFFKTPVKGSKNILKGMVNSWRVFEIISSSDLDWMFCLFLYVNE